MPAGQRIEYKYVILEEQDWTKHDSADAEGIVSRKFFLFFFFIFFFRLCFEQRAASA